MKNKFRLFNAGVFFEALNQLKIVGIIACAIYLSAGILTPIGYVIDGPYYDYELQQWIPVEFDAEYFMILFGLVYVFIPIMMMVIFFWMNKRHSCDFYHAIPVRRETMFVSTLAAVLAWALIIMAVATVIPLSIVGFNPLMETDMQTFWKGMLYIFAATIQMIGIFALGISLTGNGFTNVVASLMILVVPRAIINIIITMIEDFMPFIQMNNGDTLLNNYYNALIVPMINLFIWDGDVVGNVSLWSCAIYSIVLGLIYAVLACIMFKKRKSEVASQPSAYRIVQIVCRMIPSFLFSLLGTYFLLETTISKEYDIEMYFVAIVWYVVALLVYFIYELITTRRWRKVGASVKQLPIFVGIVVVCGLSIGLGTYFAMHREIDPEKIEYLEIEPLDGMDYFSKNKNVRITDKEIYELISDAYEEQLEEYYSEYYYSFYEDNSVTVGIKQDGVVFYREIYLSNYEMNKLEEVYVNALDEADVTVSLPKWNDNINVYLSISELYDEQLERMYEILREEVKNLSYKELFQMEESDEFLSVEIYNNGSDRDKWRSIVIPISDITPKTKTYILAALLENAKYTDTSQYEYLFDEEVQQKVTDVYGMEILIITKEKTGSYYMNTEMHPVSDEETLKMVKAITDVLKSTDGNNIVIIEGLIEVEEEYSEFSEWIGGCYRVNDEVVEKLISLSYEYK